MRGSGLSQPAQQHRQISVITCRLVSMDVPKGACSMVRQAQYNEIPPHVDYTLTEASQALYPVYEEMAIWGSRYLGSRKP